MQSLVGGDRFGDSAFRLGDGSVSSAGCSETAGSGSGTAGCSAAAAGSASAACSSAGCSETAGSGSGTAGCSAAAAGSASAACSSAGCSETAGSGSGTAGSSAAAAGSAIGSSLPLGGGRFARQLLLGNGFRLGDCGLLGGCSRFGDGSSPLGRFGGRRRFAGGLLLARRRPEWLRSGRLVRHLHGEQAGNLGE